MDTNQKKFRFKRLSANTQLNLYMTGKLELVNDEPFKVFNYPWKEFDTRDEMFDYIKSIYIHAGIPVGVNLVDGEVVTQKNGQQELLGYCYDPEKTGVVQV